jgi:teichuronic acid biosynthesis glycosyltransferase TuaG
MEKPLVSIITPSYNSAKFILETIQSVQNQTYQNWEMIIVDDCSSDETVSIIDRIANNDGRIQLFKLSKNSGTGMARNTALDKATGKFIAFLDADDLWKPEKLDKQLDFMKANNLPFTFSFYECINEAGKPLNRRIEAPLDLSYTRLFFCNYVGNLTGIYDANYFGKIPVSSLRKRQDWMMWLTVLKKIQFAQPVPESLALYRIRENSISASKFDLIKHNFSVYRTHHRFNFIGATLCMIVFLFTQLIIKPQYSKTIKASI